MPVSIARPVKTLLLHVRPVLGRSTWTSLPARGPVHLRGPQSILSTNNAWPAVPHTYSQREELVSTVAMGPISSIQSAQPIAAVGEAHLPTILTIITMHVCSVIPPVIPAMAPFPKIAHPVFRLQPPPTCSSRCAGPFVPRVSTPILSQASAKSVPCSLNARPVSTMWLILLPTAHPASMERSSLALIIRALPHAI